MCFLGYLMGKKGCIVCELQTRHYLFHGMLFSMRTYFLMLSRHPLPLNLTLKSSNLFDNMSIVSKSGVETCEQGGEACEQGEMILKVRRLQIRHLKVLPLPESAEDLLGRGMRPKMGSILLALYVTKLVIYPFI